MKWLASYICIYSLLLIIMIGCKGRHPFPDTPVLTFSGLSKDSLIQGFLNTDSIIVFFHFTDGDGDIGDLPGDTLLDLIVKDTRMQTEEYFKLPVVESTTSGPISVDGSVRIYNTCCIYEDGTPPCTARPDIEEQSLQYEIRIRDQAGHVSNAILTPKIHLQCK